MVIKCPKCDADNPSDSKYCKECATPLPSSKEIPATATLETPIEELTRGSTVAGRYEIIEELGKGGMGRVYRTLDKELNEEVALKLLNSEIASDKKTIERFNNELKIARKIGHKNVGRMYELMGEKETRFITMECISGEDLKSFIKRSKKLTTDKAISLAKQVCEGLAEAHRLGVVHRDLKPSNIMIDKEGNAKIMDFGIARSMEAREVTEAGFIIGTPDYMSPEQAEGKDIDLRSDIYSLGIVLYEMVTGELPFKGETPLSVAMKHKGEIPQDPRNLNPQISEDLSRVILKCLEKIKEQRFQSADGLRSALEKIEKGIPLDEIPVEKKKTFFRSLLQILKERKLIQTLAGFIGGGWLILEVVHWILIDHYHLPERTLDVAIVTLLGALVCTLVWRFFGGMKRRLGKVKIELIMIPLVIVVTAFVDARLILSMGETDYLRGLDPEKLIETRSNNSVAVMYFKNNTGDEDYDIWRSALCESIITDLSQSRYVYVLSSDRLYSILKKFNLLEARGYATEDLIRVAAEGRVAHVLQGSLTKAGDMFRIDYTLQEISNEKILGSDRVEGKGEESIFTMVDELTRLVKSNLNLTEQEIAGDADKEIGRITTNSPEAYKYYVLGRMYNAQADLPKSKEYMEKAIAVDPGFAMAYRSLAAAAYDREINLRKAMELSDRLSENERHWIQGDFYFHQGEGSYERAIEAYTRLVEFCPESWVGNTYLGFIFLRTEEWDKAIDRLELSIRNAGENYFPYAYQVSAYMAKGQYDKAREVLESYLENFEDHTSIRNYLAFNDLCQGKYDLALIEVDKALALNPTYYDNLRRKGKIYHCLGDWTRAEQEYRNLQKLQYLRGPITGRERMAALSLSRGKFNEAKDHARSGIEVSQELGVKEYEPGFHLNLAYIDLRRGNPEQALDACRTTLEMAREAQELCWERNALHFKGLTFVEMKSTGEARKTAKELRDVIEKGMNKKIIRLYHHLMGKIELSLGNTSRAIEYFQKAVSLLPAPSELSINWGANYDDRALFMEALASAYYEIGDLERAQEEYEKIGSMTTGKLFYGDISVRSLYMLGKICEQKGWPGKAIEHYEKFLDLWRDADPGFPEVEDAKKRLDGLKNQ